MDHIYQVKIHFLGRTISEYSSLISAIVKKKKKKITQSTNERCLSYIHTSYITELPTFY